MSSIDERVVEAKFDNKQFQSGVKDTLGSLDNLKKGLNLEGASKGLDSVGAAAGRVSNGINVMRIAAVTAIATIAHQATYAGEQFVKSFTVGPLLDGLHEYETQLNSIQTILSNTQWEHTNLEQVNGALLQLNNYADKTIYNFSEMARNVGTFTAAGVKLDVSVNAIQGIANLAAVSGSNAQQASTAMYQLSQALASGTVKLMDWNSVVNAGMGGKVFQDALIQTAKVHGKNIDSMIKKEGSFRNTLQEGWLTSEILTETLSKFTATDTKHTRAVLKHQGYNEKEIEQIIKLGKNATDAATKVKTFTQLMSTLREAAGSGWTQSWQAIIGDFGQAKKLWTGVYNVIGGAITHSAKARNALLKDWADLGGRQLLLDSISNAFHNLMDILKPVKDAFREIFPKKTAADLWIMTARLKDFIDNFKIGAETADKVKRIFAGVFAIFDIGWQVIKGVAHVFGELIGAFAGSSAGGILEFVASIGDMLVALDKAIKSGEGFTNFFDKIANILKPIITVLGITRIAFLDLLTGVAIGVKQAGSIAPKVLETIGNVIQKIQDFFSHMFDGVDFDNVLNLLNAGLFAGVLLLVRKFIKHLTRDKGPGVIETFLNKITKPFEDLTATLQKMQQALQVATLVELAVAVGILTASVFTLSKINAKDLAKSLAAIGAMFAELMGALALFNKVGGAQGLFTTAAGLTMLAVALRVMTSSVVVLAALSWEQLAKGVSATTVLIGGLVLATKGMAGNAGGMIRAGAGLILLAAGIKILASAVKDIAALSWGQMAKGLTGVAATLLALTLFTKFADANGAGITQGAGLLLLATGIKVLADAATEFAKLSWGQIAKGLTSISAILLVFAIFSKTVGNPVSLLASGVALVAISVAMNVLARALQEFASMSWGEIVKGLVTLAGALAIIAIAMAGMETALLGAAALVLISGSLVVLSGALKVMGGMSWGEIAKGMVTLAGALTIIALAMAGMIEALPGAAALLVVVAALVPLTAVLKVLGSMGWMAILEGLVALAGALTIIGLAAALLTPLIPSLFGMAAGIALLGVGLAAIGGAVFLFASGLQILAVSGAAAGGAIKLLVEDIVGLLPYIAKAVGVTLVELSKAIVKAAPDLIVAAIVLIDGILFAIRREGPKIISTFVTMLLELITQVARAVPKIVDKILVMMVGILHAIQRHEDEIIGGMVDIIVGLLNAVTKRIPMLVRAGTGLIVAFLQGIADNVGDMITAGTNIIIAFIEGIGNAATQLMTAAFETLLHFLQSIAAAIEQYEPELIQAGIDIAKAIVVGFFKGMAGGLGGLFGKVKDVFGMKGVSGVAFKVLDAQSPSKVFVRLGQYVIHGFIKGLIGGKEKVAATWKDLHERLMQEVEDTKSRIDDFKAKLKDLEEHPKKNADAIAKLTAKLNGAKAELAATTGALDLMKNGLDKQHDHLIRLSKRYDEYTVRLDKANQKLKEAKQVRDDYNKSTQESYNKLPDMAADTTLSDYETRLKKQIIDEQSFNDVMEQLAKMGLDDKTYKELVDKGPDMLPFAEQILAGGKSAVDELNSMDKQLRSQAIAMGKEASAELYQAGVDAAQGVVNGLREKRADIAKEMRRIAHILVAELKKELKIKSPSQVFDDLGQFTGKGLARGINKSVPHVQKATRALGKNTIESMKQSIRDMNDLLADHGDLNPTIKPVLDLSAVRRQATNVGQILGSKKIAMDASYLKALNASAGYESNSEISPDGISGESPPPVSFVQNNYSPRALSSAEIYRNTHNQLSKAKGALNPSAA